MIRPYMHGTALLGKVCYYNEYSRLSLSLSLLLKQKLMSSGIVLPIESMLEPDSFYYNPGESRFSLQGSYARDSRPWITIRQRHPWVCLTSERIHWKLFLVAKKEDADSENGMVIYKAKWDGDLSNFSYDLVKHDLSKGDQDRLMAIEPEIKFVEHVRASKALQRLDAIAEWRE